MGKVLESLMDYLSDPEWSEDAQCTILRLDISEDREYGFAIVEMYGGPSTIKYKKEEGIWE